MAQVRRGMLVYDPFVGTGSILIAAAHHGAMTLGADIDPRVISVGKVRRCPRWHHHSKQISYKREGQSTKQASVQFIADELHGSQNDVKRPSGGHVICRWIRTATP